MEFFDLKRGKGKMKVSSNGKINNSSNIEINNKIGRTSTYRHLFYKFPENIMIGMLSDNDIYKLHMKNNSTKIHYKKINKDDKNSVMSGEWNGKEKYSTITFMREYREGSVFPISLLSLLFNILKKNGTLVFNTEQNVNIEMIYLLLLLFEEVVILFGNYFLCKKFNPTISKTDFEKSIKESYSISPKNSLTKLQKYLSQTDEYKQKLLKMIQSDNYDELDMVYYKNYLEFINKLSGKIPQGELTEILIKFNAFYLSKEEGKDKNSKKKRKSYNRNSGELVKLRAAVGNREGRYLQRVLKKNKFKKCLEVGLAFGVSTFNIITAIYKNGGTLVSIDPNQSGKWNNMGKKLIMNIGLDKHHTIYEDKSYVVMPELLKKEEGSYDFVFIDGWHTFDYTLIDFFYGDKLLRIGGYIVIDDALHQGVEKTLKYLDKNYSGFYKRIKGGNVPSTFGVYEKLREDTRDWDDHENF